MNHLAAEVVLEAVTGDSDSPRQFISVRLLIDGEDCTDFDDLSIQPAALVASARRPGVYFLGACSCGSPGCARVHHGVEVTHEEHLIRWRVPAPYVCPPNGPVRIDAWKERTFPANEYREQIDGVVTALNKLAKREDAGERFSIDCHPGTFVRGVLELIGCNFGGYDF